MKIREWLELIIFNKIKNKGKNNKIEVSKVKIKNSQIYIDGNENYLKLAKGIKIKNTKIFIKGNNIRVVIDENVKILDSFLEIYGNSNKIFVGGY